MTRAELVDQFLTGELNESGLVEFEAALEADPAFVRALLDQRRYDLALRILLGDETANQQVTVSVLSVVRGKPEDDFKTDLLKTLGAQVEEKPRSEKPVRAPAAPPRRRRPARRRSWVAVMAGPLAACVAIFAGWLLIRDEGRKVSEDPTGFLLSASPDVRVRRAGDLLTGRRDMILQHRDRIVVGENGSARVGFAADTSRIDLGRGAVVRFLQGGSNKSVELFSGEIEILLDAPADRSMVVTTPHAELRLREGRVRLECASAFTRVDVREGSATLIDTVARKSARVGAGQYAIAGEDVELIARTRPSVRPETDESGAVAVLIRTRGDTYLFSNSPADRTPVGAGQSIGRNQGIVTVGENSSATVEYRDRTRVELGGDTLVRRFTGGEDDPKHVRFDAGSLVSSVVKQPAGRPMRLTTDHASVEVVGTRFLLARRKEYTRVQVEEGAVRFTSLESKKTVVVRSGYTAATGGARPLESLRVPGGIRYLHVDLESGGSDGDGEWTLVGRTLQQDRVSRLPDGMESPVSNRFFEVELSEGALLEADVLVSRVTPDSSPERSAWGFGLVTAFGVRNVVLRTRQAAEGGSVFEFMDDTAIPFEHGREGRFRLKLLIERSGNSGPSILKGKIWQGHREPDGWMIEGEQPIRGSMTRIGFQTLRCACVFSSLRVRVLDGEDR